MENYLLALTVFAGLYALMALGLNVIWGLAGMVNLGLAGFYLVGAYAAALLTTSLHWPLPAAWLAATLAGAALGAAVAGITARLRGDYLAIVTLGFAEVLRQIAANETWLTGGTDGISAIPGPGRGVLSPLAFNAVFAVIVWIAVAIVAMALVRLSGAPWGRVLRALREDETVAAVAGKRTVLFKIQAFAVGAGVLGLAGALYANFNNYVAPDSFQPLITIYVVLALTAGGTGNMAGAVVGSVLVVALMEGTRFAAAAIPGLSPVQVASVREGAIGAALILILHLRPTGPVARAEPPLSATTLRRRHPVIDTASIVAAHADTDQPGATFRALDRALAAAPGHILFTVLVHHPARRESERFYSNMPTEYPVGGSKPVTNSPWMQTVIERGEPYIGRTREDIKDVFYDHELIWSLGCESVLNLPVRWRGQTMGTLNLLHRAGFYDTAHVEPVRLAAHLALPALLMITRS